MTAQVDSREAMLRAVRAARPSAVPLPDVAAALVARPAFASSCVEAFTLAAQQAGAEVLRAARGDVMASLAARLGDSARVVSMVSDIPGSASHLSTPHAAVGIDVLVCESTCGVAENGAVWLTESALPQRAVLFLAHHVVVLLPESALVPDLHAAYARLLIARESFGAFVAGPSKTADIEQSLVVGAQGAMGLTVVLCA